MTGTAELFSRLSGDARRIRQPFSDDLLQANALLHNSAATEEEMAECLNLWCQHKQPCQFGRVAGSRGRIHFCFLTEEAVTKWSDEEIAEKILEEKRLWKQRAAFDPLRGAHSFVIVVASPQVALAAPDKHLRAFADRLIELAAWEPDRRGARRKNSVTSDFLYLKHPTDGGFYGFRFNIDFFACAADGRWWHDHRFPGGIAFTANSTGHMMAFREWYEGKEDSRSWAVKQAMFTIQNAAPTRKTQSADPLEQGRVTWLRPLDEEGNPLLKQIKCPLAKVPSILEGKDWTRYEGVLHTDHAVRAEFFLDREVAPTSTRPYLMDFTYLYDTAQDDFLKFSGGEPFSQQQIFEEIGRPEDWAHRAKAAGRPRSNEEAMEVAEQLDACRKWEGPQWDAN
ncbi:MAG: hypothetical protein R2729_03710 [Bryobacteraceae bacterium]